MADGNLTFYRNYFVTGDYVVGGVGLRGLGDATGFANGIINIPDTLHYPTATSVPPGAVIVAAFLYWQTVEKAQSASAGQKGFFNGHAIIGRSLGNPNAPVSWSAGGCAGSSNGTTTLRTYRADVRPFLTNPVDGSLPTSWPVRLADSGSNGGGAPLTEGATLVIIYRDLSKAIPPIPLRAISILDGTLAPGNSSQSVTLTIGGFYQSAAATAPPAPAAGKLTHIVGNGQLNKTEQLVFNGGTSISNSPFPGLLNGSWDNPTFNVSVPAGDGVTPQTVTTSVIPAATNSGCVSWGAVIFSTPVQDTDNDGLLDIWETNKGYTHISRDISNGVFVSLPDADPLTKDIYIQVDYLVKTDSNGKILHSHLPKIAAFDKLGEALKNAPVDCDPLPCKGIQLHVDVGSNYQIPPDPYIVPSAVAAVAKGGNQIDEDKVVTCTDHPLAAPNLLCEFPGEPAISWKGSFTKFKNKYLQSLGRKDSYRYLLAGHALGLATNIWSISSGTLVSISISIDPADPTRTMATVTTKFPHNLDPGALVRVRVSGVVAPPALVPGPNFTLNGTYEPITVTSSTTFTFKTHSVLPLTTYNNSNSRGLFVAQGEARSTSGWGDGKGGADMMVTLGKWHFDPAPDDNVLFQNGSANTQAGTIAHELGHLLGLGHGGGDNDNCKSNYLSVMNYMLQRGIPDYQGLLHIDYSGQKSGGLNEGSLDETSSTGFATAKYRTRWYAPPSFLDTHLGTQVVLNQVGRAGSRVATMHCDGTPITDAAQMVRVEGPLLVGGLLDWNNNGSTSNSGIVEDINFNGKPDNGPFPALAFTGFDDWANIDLRQTGARRGAFGFSGSVWGSGSLDDGSGGSLDDGSGGSLDDGSGGSLDDGSGGTLDDGSGGTLDDGSGGTLDDGSGGIGEGDFDRANSAVDPPTGLTCTNCVSSPGSTTVIENGHSVPLSWTPTDFQQIRTVYIWRAVGTISPSNLPVLIKTLTGTPPASTFTDPKVQNKTTYTYFVTSALGADSGPKNKGNQSGPSNMITVTVLFN